MRPAIALAALALVLGLSGCGGSDTAQTQAGIPVSLAGSLGDRSEAIAASLEAGDQCGAARKADELKHAADDAIAAGEIPAAFQAELERVAMELQNEVNCPPLAGKSDEKGKKKGHEKHNGDGATISTGKTTGEEGD